MRKLSLAVLALLLTVAVALPAEEKEPVKPAKPVSLAFNTAEDEDDPYPAPNGLKLYYTTKVKGKTVLRMSARANAGQPWRAGKEPDELYVISKDTEVRGLYLVGEARPPFYVFYASKKPDDKEATFDIFAAIKNLPGPDKVFETPTPILSIDTPEEEMHPWLSADGRSLYFSRKTKEGWRVLMAQRKTATGLAGFGEPITLDLPPGFHHPTLTPDGKTMYLQGPLEKDRWGLFVATRTDKGWSLPEALDMLNNAEGPTGDRSPALSRDGTRLYFASDRPGGKGGLDLYVIETAQLVKKK
jgi:Tol biopolymer transport system component